MPRMSRWVVDGNRHGQVDRPVRDLTIADLDMDSVDEYHRVDTIERLVLPLGHAIDHLVGDGGDGLLDTSVPYTSARCAAICPWVRPLADSGSGSSSTPPQTPLPLSRAAALWLIMV